MMHGITLPGPGKAKNRGRVRPQSDKIWESIEFPQRERELELAQR